MVVIKNEDARVLRIDLTTHAPIAGAKIAILHVAWPRRAFMFDGLAAPGPVLAMRRNDHPFFAQRMPALFPSHQWFPLECAGRAQRRRRCGCSVVERVIRWVDSSSPKPRRRRYMHARYTLVTV